MSLKGSVREKLTISVSPLFYITKFVWFMLKASFLVIGKISIKKSLFAYNFIIFKGLLTFLHSVFQDGYFVNELTEVCKWTNWSV